MSELDDLAALIGPSPGEDIRLVQGVIKSWNPNTFENEVDVDGVLRRNLRVGSGIEALTYQPGDVVLVAQWFPGGRKGELGVGTSWIVGRIITPGTGAAEQAIAFMQTSLARQLSLEIIQDRVHQGVAAAQAAFHESTPGLDYVRHPQGSPARVEGVEVVTGVAIVMAFSLMSWARNDEFGMGGSIAIDVSGATTIPAGVGTTIIGAANDNGYAGSAAQSIGGVRVFDSLNPGRHNFEIMYRAQFPFTGEGSLITFNGDALIVIAF